MHRPTVTVSHNAKVVSTISANFIKVKSKVDNLFRGSKRSRSLQNRYYNTPLFTGPINGCHMQVR